MTTAVSSEKVISAKERIIVALDVSSADEARSIVDELHGEVGAFKVGLQLFSAEGPELVRDLVARGSRVFLDLKFHDIPNTVANAAVEAARLGVWMINVHALGGREMMTAAAAAVDAACRHEGLARPLLVAVTILTSSSDETLREAGIDDDVEEQVLRLVKLTAASGFDGVVASPLEAAKIKSYTELKGMLVVTPGIRPNSATSDDQRRVMTPEVAVLAGSDYIVIGRPILTADDRVAAVRRIIDDITTFTE